MKHGIFNYQVIKPFAKLGFNGPFWDVHIDTLMYTWAAMAVMLALAIVGRIYTQKKVNYVSIIYEKILSFFISLCKESFGFFHYRYFVFISSLFFFTLFSCLIGLIPFLDESTKDLNTTFALGLSSFSYVQLQKIRTFGIFAYIRKFFQPVFLLAPINIIGELAKIASMSFRLFGNILGGSIIFGMIIGLIEQQPLSTIFLSYAAIVITLSIFVSRKKSLQRTSFAKAVNGCLIAVFVLVWAQMFFGIFEGAIQAFVLTMLTTTYLSMGTQNKQDNDAEKIETEA